MGDIRRGHGDYFKASIRFDNRDGMLPKPTVLSMVAKSRKK